MTKQLEQTIAKIEALDAGQLLLTVEPDAETGGFCWNDADTTGITTDEVQALAAEVKRLREGLEHYADASNWMCHRQYNLHDCRTDTCWMGAYESGNGEGYDHARKILEGE